MPWVEGQSEVHVQLLNDRNVFPWLTTKQLAWYDPVLNRVFTVPKYFRTDGASIPIALAALPVVGPALVMRYFGSGVFQGFREGVLHDYLRRKAPVLDDSGNIAGHHPAPIPAADAHRIFRDALIDGGYPEDLVENYYAAVKAFNSDDHP